MNREAKTFDKIVIVNEYNEITILQEAFKYNDGFKGLTGAMFRPISKKEDKEAITLKSVT